MWHLVDGPFCYAELALLDLATDAGFASVDHARAEARFGGGEELGRAGAYR